MNLLFLPHHAYGPLHSWLRYSRNHRHPKQALDDMEVLQAKRSNAGALVDDEEETRRQEEEVFHCFARDHVDEQHACIARVTAKTSQAGCPSPSDAHLVFLVFVIKSHGTRLSYALNGSP